MKIRRFKKGDEKICSEVIYSCVDNAKKLTKKEKDFLKRYYTPEKILKLTKKSYFFVVTQKKKLIGMGRLEKNKIATIYFDMEYQRKRGGTLIMNYLEKFALKKAIKKVFLEALLQAVGFYKKKGFKRVKLKKIPIRCYKMSKNLKADYKMSKNLKADY